MTHSPQQLDGVRLLRDGWPDEDVERFTGLTLPSIILLRAEAAAGFSYGLQPARPPEPPGSPQA